MDEKLTQLPSATSVAGSDLMYVVTLSGTTPESVSAPVSMVLASVGGPTSVPVPIAQGGTAGTTTRAARDNLLYPFDFGEPIWMRESAGGPAQAAMYAGDTQQLVLGQGFLGTLMQSPQVLLAGGLSSPGTIQGSTIQGAFLYSSGDIAAAGQLSGGSVYTTGQVTANYVASSTGIFVTTGSIHIAQGMYLWGGNNPNWRGLIGYDGASTVINGATTHNGNLNIVGGGFILPQGWAISSGARTLAYFDGTNTIIGGPIYSDGAINVASVTCRGTLTLQTGGITVPTQQVIQDTGGAWIAYVRTTPHEILYAYNVNCNFNEFGGRTTFFGDVDHRTIVYFPNGASINTLGQFITHGVYNIDGGVWYTSPDYVFEEAYTGTIEVCKDAPGARTYTRLSLTETEAYTREHWRLPHHPKAASPELFARSSEMLAELERVYLHLFDHERRMTTLEDSCQASR